MNLYDAHKTGRKYRRIHKGFGKEFGNIVKPKSSEMIYGVDAIYYEFDHVLENNEKIKITMTLSMEDVLADDWEVESIPIEVTVKWTDEGGLIYPQIIKSSAIYFEELVGKKGKLVFIEEQEVI